LRSASSALSLDQQLLVQAMFRDFLEAGENLFLKGTFDVMAFGGVLGGAGLEDYFFLWNVP